MFQDIKDEKRNIGLYEKRVKPNTSSKNNFYVVKVKIDNSSDIKLIFKFFRNINLNNIIGILRKV